LRLAMELIDLSKLFLQDHNAVGRSAAILVAGQFEVRTRSDQGMNRFGIEMLEDSGDEVVDPVVAEVAMGDQFGVAREADDADDGLDALIQSRQPPAPGAAHADAAGADLGLVHLRAGFEVIEQALLVAEHHAPEGAAKPEVELEQAGFRSALPLRLAR